MRFARQCTDLTVKVYEQLFLMGGYASALQAIYSSAGIAAFSPFMQLGGFCSQRRDQ
jgi:hypothetical protein